MKAKRDRRAWEGDMGNEQALVEMRSFLQALASYPERFAANPRITFEQYRSSLVEGAVPAAGSTNGSRKN